MPRPPFSFAGFRFDPATGELTGPTGAIRLGPQPARVLAMLVEHSGALVTRAELKDALWGNAAVEADMGLNTCIRQIRSALGDEAEQGHFIETLPKRGYRFVAAVDGAVPAPAPAALPAANASGRARVYAGIGVLCVVVLGVGGFFATRLKNRNVAILPMVPRTGDPSWVADVDSRLTEQLVVKLTAHSPGTIGVVGPATTGRLAGDPRPHTEIGKSLNVGFVMSGGVRVSDSTAFFQVIRVSDGVHVYAMRRPVFGVNIDSLTAAIASGAAAKILAR